VSESVKAPKEYLREPYSRVLTPDEETGTYTAEIREFPGCVAQGDSPEEAYRNLEAAAESWIEVALEVGQAIPEPAQEESYSGRVALRLPKSLHRRAAQAAERDGTSLNQFLVAAVAEQLGAGRIGALIAERSEQRVRAAQVLEERARRLVGMGDVTLGAARAIGDPMTVNLMASHMPLEINPMVSPMPHFHVGYDPPGAEERLEGLLTGLGVRPQQKASAS
jgi:predicted RNase H-like HicB family nuclease